MKCAWLEAPRDEFSVPRMRSAPAFVHPIHGAVRCRMGSHCRVAGCTSTRGKITVLLPKIKAELA